MRRAEKGQRQHVAPQVLRKGRLQVAMVTDAHPPWWSGPSATPRLASPCPYMDTGEPTLLWSYVQPQPRDSAGFLKVMNADDWDVGVDCALEDALRVIELLSTGPVTEEDVAREMSVLGPLW